MLKSFLTTTLLLLIPIFIIGAYLYYEQWEDDKTVLEIQAVESLDGQAERICLYCVRFTIFSGTQ